MGTAATIVLLAIASTASWFFSMLAGGGSSLILMPLVGGLLGTQAIPLVMTISGIIGNSERVVVYRDRINWSILRWELPGAVIGAILGAFSLSQLKLEWLSGLVAIFIILSAARFFLKGSEPTFRIKLWYFLPAGFIYAFLSGLIGSMGPIFASFYINAGLEKEAVLATQATNRIVIHAVKILAYIGFGVFHLSHFGYGLLIGCSAVLGNWLGGLMLEKISEQRFQRLVFSLLMMSGFLLLWQSRAIAGLA